MAASRIHTKADILRSQVELPHEQLGAGPTFTTAYRVYRGVVAATLRQNGVASASLEDAIQDTFLVAYRRRSDFDGLGVQAWLRAIARRVAHNYRRTRSRANRKHLALEFGSKRPPVNAEVHVNVRIIEQFVASLSPNERELFVLSELEGRTSRELADSLHENQNTLYSRIRVLRERLRRGLHSVFVFGAPALKSPVLIGAAAMLVSGVTALAVVGRVPPTATALAPIVDPRTDSPSTTAVKGDDSSSVPNKAPFEVATAPTDIAIEHALTPTKPKAARASGPSHRARAPGREPSVEAGHDELAEQSRHLLEADQALRRGELSVALEMIDRHVVDFPRSTLSDLREAIRIDVLARSGRREEACTKAREFLRLHADTTSSARVERSCPGVHESRENRK